MPGGVISPAAIRFPEMSCLRSKLAEPEDALRPGCCNGRKLPTHGVIGFMAAAVPSHLKSLANNYMYEFVFDHKPVRKCYSHAEVSALLLPVGLSVDLDDEAKALMRAAIVQHSSILIQPGQLRQGV